MSNSDILCVDARGMKCPWPVLRAAKSMRNSNHVTLLADDPATPGELCALAEEQGWTVKQNANGAGFSFDIQR